MPQTSNYVAKLNTMLRFVHVLFPIRAHRSTAQHQHSTHNTNSCSLFSGNEHQKTSSLIMGFPWPCEQGCFLSKLHRQTNALILSLSSNRLTGSTLIHKWQACMFEALSFCMPVSRHFLLQSLWRAQNSCLIEIEKG